VILNIKGKGSKIRQSPISEDLWNEIQNYISLNDLKQSSYLFSDEKNQFRQLSTFAIWRAVILRRAE
jgi:integrase